MTPVEQQEMVDAINRTAATVARLEDVLRELLAAQTEQNKAIASYIVQMQTTYNAVLQAQKPWWRR